MSKVEQRLAAAGITLPQPVAPIANYVPFVRTGNLVFVTGQLSKRNGERRFIGKLGREFDVEEGRQAARLCALNVIAQLRAALDDDLDRVARCVRIAGFVNSMPEFHGQSQVMNGASDVLSRSSATRVDTRAWRLGSVPCRTTSPSRSKARSRSSSDLHGAPAALEPFVGWPAE
jgi:enamine deaminase RidA (YjgF/YER057c/UK114 family)